MCNERILRQNQAIANKLSTEWYGGNVRYRSIICVFRRNAFCMRHLVSVEARSRICPGRDQDDGRFRTLSAEGDDSPHLEGHALVESHALA